MASAWGRAYFRATATQVGIATTNSSKIRRFPIPLPPLEEQERLLQELDVRLSKMDALRLEVTKQSLLLREHRQALITAAVTGGLDAIGRAA